VEEFVGKGRKLVIENYMKCPRLSICENNNRFKYDEEGNIERVFLLRYRRNNISNGIIGEISKYNLNEFSLANIFRKFVLDLITSNIELPSL
jgi:hypothetical protein